MRTLAWLGKAAPALCIAAGLAQVAIAGVSSAGGWPRRDALAASFIDVEGGQSTLIVTPNGESLLVDAGYGADGRDAARIIEAMREAGVSRIDRLIVTHLHPDHIGGIPALAERVPIGMTFDHGDEAVPDDLQMGRALEGYRRVRPQLHASAPRVGDTLRLGDVTLTWVSADAHTLSGHLPGGGAANPGCSAYIPDAESPEENPRSTGFLLEFGRFRFLDLGDLTGMPLQALLCPISRIGPVDVLVLPHHGEEDGTFPALLEGLRPRSVVINNGARKGARQGALDLLHRWMRATDVWQLHLATAPEVTNFPDPFVANLDTSTSFALVLEAQQDGSFSVTNRRTGEPLRRPFRNTD